MLLDDRFRLCPRLSETRVVAVQSRGSICNGDRGFNIDTPDTTWHAQHAKHSAVITVLFQL